MKPISAYTVILNTIANCVNKICAMGPFREEDAKSTFLLNQNCIASLKWLVNY